MSINLGSLAITSSKTTFTAPNQGMKALLIGNESGYTVTIRMQSGGVQKTLYPSTVDWFAIKPGFTGQVEIVPTAILNNIAAFPASSLIFDAVGLDDPEEAYQYPISLNRSTTIGGTVSTAMGGSTSLQNDGNAAGTQIVEATVSGDPSSAVSLKNDGTLVLGNTTHKGSISSDNAKFTTDGSGNVIEQNATVQGNLAVTGTSTFTGAATANGALNAAGAGTGLAVTNNETVGGTLGVTGAATFSGDIAANGAGTGLAVQNNETVGGTLAVTGDVTITGKLIQNGVGTIINGSVAGTVTFFTPIWGTALKILIILTSPTYNDATSHTFVFPSAVIAGMAYLGNEGTSTVTFKNGSTAEGTDLTTTLGGASAGAHTNVTAIKSDSLGQFDAIAGADRVTFAPGGSIGNGVFIFIGA